MVMCPSLNYFQGLNDVNNWITSGNVTDAVRDGASFGGLVMEYLPSGGYRDLWSSGNPTDPSSARLYKKEDMLLLDLLQAIL